MTKGAKMRNRRVRAIVFELIFPLAVGSIFFAGCAANSGGLVMSPEKVRVIHLKSGSEYQELLSGRPQSHGMRSGRVYLEPGQSCGRHTTKAHEEMLIFLAGKGTALVGEEEKAFEVGKGAVCYIPPHTIHNIKNTGTEALVYIYCVAPVKD